MTPPQAEELVPRLFIGPALRTQPDKRLVKLVRDGYEAAFEEIVRRYGAALGRYAQAIVGGRAEDVTQDAFSKALLALRRDETEIELRPWLYRIVRNTALNDLRDSPPTPQVLAEALAAGGSVSEEVEQREELTALMTRLQALPEPQRAAIVMRELEGLGHEEIAAALGVSGGAARQAIHRARTALRDGLGLALPLPLLKALLESSAAAPAEMAAGAAGASGVAGAGVALKAAAATVLVAGTVGAGVALHESRHHERTQAATTPIKSDSADVAPALAQPTAEIRPTSGVDDRSGGDSAGDRGRHSSESESGNDHGGRGHGGGDGGRPTHEPGHDHGGNQTEPGDDHGGFSGSGRGGPGHGGGDDSASSPTEPSHHGDGGPGGSAGSGSSGGGPGPGGNSGSGDGGSGSGSPVPNVEPVPGGGDGGSGSGDDSESESGSSGSGSGSGSSGSGSGSGGGNGSDDR